jgi:hypothetical protein
VESYFYDSQLCDTAAAGGDNVEVGRGKREEMTRYYYS